MITEADLKAAQSGDSEAFTKIYNETVKTAYYVAKRILVDADSDAVEDVLQEAYVAVYKHLGDYKAGNFQGWVDTIVANRAKNYLRKKNPILFTEMETEENPVVEFEDEKIEFRPNDNVDYSETKRLVMEIVDGLSAEQRLATILFYFEERSVKEIAEICECSENTIKSRLNYARKKIKEDVLALEKKGTKLYSISAIPFLIWMLSEEAKACVVSEATSATILTGIQSATGNIAMQAAGEVGKEAVKTVAKEVAGEAGKEVAKTVAAEATKATTASVVKTAAVKTGMALGTKIAIAVTAATVTVGGIAGGVAIVQNNQERYEEDSDKDKDSEEKDDVTNQNSELETESQDQGAENVQIIYRLKKETKYYSDENYQSKTADMIVTYMYDDEGRCILGEGINANGQNVEYVKYVYDDEGYLLESKDITSFNYLYEYNEEGLLSKTMKYSGDTLLETIWHEYGGNGYLIKDTVYDADGTVSYVSEYMNNASGKVLQIKTDYTGLQLDTKTVHAYDADENLVITETYNDNGLASSEKRYYDAKGNLVKCEYYGSNGLAQSETLEYDSNGNLLCKTVAYGSVEEPYLIQRSFYEYEEVIVLGHVHNYTAEETKVPTCADDGQGEITYTCSCGDTYTEETDRIDHCTDDIEIIQEATCSQVGLKTYSCIFCGREFEREELPKLPHTESDWIVVTEATATSEGLKHKVCTVCGEELESEIIPSTGN